MFWRNTEKIKQRIEKLLEKQLPLDPDDKRFAEIENEIDLLIRELGET